MNIPCAGGPGRLSALANPYVQGCSEDLTETALCLDRAFTCHSWCVSPYYSEFIARTAVDVVSIGFACIAENARDQQCFAYGTAGALVRVSEDDISDRDASGLRHHRLQVPIWLVSGSKLRIYNASAVGDYGAAHGVRVSSRHVLFAGSGAEGRPLDPTFALGNVTFSLPG